MMLFYLFGVHAIGANGVIDFVLYNLPLGIEKSNWPMYILVGLIMAVLYFLLFRFLILKFDLKPPVARAMKPKPGCIPKPITKEKPPPPHRQLRVTASARSSSPGWGANKISRWWTTAIPACGSGFAISQPSMSSS